jgi:hypothetical protein
MQCLPRDLKPLAVVALALYATGARADDSGTSVFSLGGFGTLGVVHSSEDRADFTGSIFKPSGAGHTRAWSADVDSLIAAQATARFTPKLSAVLQVVSEQDHEGTYRPHVEWANVKYQFTPEFSARIGRTVLPIYMVADSRKVNYANPWVRPPTEVYAMVPITSNDGVDASLRVAVGPAINTIQLTAGRSDSKFPDNRGLAGGTAEARHLVAVADTLESGFATVRFSVGRMRLTIPELGALFDGFRQFGPQGRAIADRYDVSDRPVTYYAVGASYDPGRWFVMGEWSKLSSNPTIGGKTGWYVTGGYRMDKVTPFASYAQANAGNLSAPGLTVSGLPAQLAASAERLNATLNGMLGSKVVQDTFSVGGRWDFMRNATFTLQYDRTRVGAGSTGALRNIQPGFEPGGNVNVFSATIDFVF